MVIISAASGNKTSRKVTSENACKKRKSEMKAVIQRVTSAAVTVEGNIVGRIGPGVLVLLGIEKGDVEAQADWLVDKICGLRIFYDDDGKMNRSVADNCGSLLVVSQFTLAGNCSKGRRPSFDTAAPADEGKRLYEYFVAAARNTGLPVETGIFQADMQVSLVNDGPVTFILER
ncbi:MAG TPA: D-aminoacyl-tRNA deacylase [Dongiaceae bacterium]|nr:D-aminoacyl-tRNA deacylase [Dongiaceae bacterium]